MAAGSQTGGQVVRRDLGRRGERGRRRRDGKVLKERSSKRKGV